MASWRTARLLYHSVKHTRPSQLWQRLGLIVRRRYHQERPASVRRLEHKTALVQGQVAVNDILPMPIFQPRVGLVDEGQVPTLQFLNMSHPLRMPLDWCPKEHNYGTRLWLLNLHYMEYLEALDESTFEQVIRHWIIANPPYGQRYWLHNWNAYALSIRVVVWLQEFARRDIDLADEKSKAVLLSMLMQMSFLEHNLERDIGGNHLVKNIKALLWAAACLNGPPADQWGRLGQRLLEKQLKEQVLTDGMHFELSPSYHCQVFADLLECHVVLPAGDVKKALESCLHHMAQAVADFTHPDGQVSLFNDGGLNMAYQPTELLEAYKSLLGETVTANHRIEYSSAGYFGLRNHRDLLLIDCGPLAPDSLPAHGHGDMFSFELSIDGRRIFIDPGVYEYNEGPRRRFSRSTAAHNTLTLDNEDQSEFWKSFRVGRRAKLIARKVHLDDEGIDVSGTHNGYRRLAGKPMHRRQVAGSTRALKITDEVLGGNGQNATARLMLHPDCRTEKTGDNTVQCMVEELVVTVVATASIGVENSRCFLDFGHEQACKQLVIEYGPAPAKGTIEISASTL